MKRVEQKPLGTAKKAKRRSSSRSPEQAEEPRVSLAPLDPETALRGLLQVKPDNPPAETGEQPPAE